MMHSQQQNDRHHEDNADNADNTSNSNGQESLSAKGRRRSSRDVPSLPTPDLPPSPFSPQHPPSLRSASDSPSMTPSSTPLGNINAARRPPPRAATTTGSTDLAEDIQAKMKAFSLSRQGAPASSSSSSSANNSSPAAASPLAGGINPSALPNGPAVAGRVPPGTRLPHQVRPVPLNFSPTQSTSGGDQGSPPLAGPNAGGGGGGLAAKRGLKSGMKLSDAVTPPTSGSGDQKSNDAATDSTSGTAAGKQEASKPSDPNAFNRYADLIDAKAGTLNFKNKAVIHGGGIEFITGRSFKISLDDIDMLEELGKGNYGSVYRVRHCKPRIRRPGLGLGGFVSPRQQQQPPQQQQQHPENVPPSEGKSELSNVVMALKEIRLELDDAQFTAIIMELDILHRCASPFVIDFYGAFFQEGAVYMCVEYMDGGSVEKLYDGGIPENILRKIALSTAMGLKSLKDEHNIIHRDVKPTNILLNTRGHIKICDFGVSGNLVASIAKTNIGCQSYMAPERIAGGSAGPNPGTGAYSVQSDVWSLGLSLVECARGAYPYPPEAYTNIFSQLNAIVKGDPPQLPDDGYSDEAKDFVSNCLNKKSSLRPSYAQLIRHPWLASLLKPPASEDGDPSSTAEEKASADQENGVEPPTADYPDSPPTDVFDEEVSEWVRGQLDRRLSNRPDKARPALHAVALDAVAGGPLLDTSFEARITVAARLGPTHQETYVSNERRVERWTLYLGQLLGEDLPTRPSSKS